MSEYLGLMHVRIFGLMHARYLGLMHVRIFRVNACLNI